MPLRHRRDAAECRQDAADVWPRGPANIRAGIDRGHPGSQAALNLGLTAVKFFPAEAIGGVKSLKALSAPYADVKFMPTGGVSAVNVQEYLALKCVLACGGSCACPRSRLAPRAPSLASPTRRSEQWTEQPRATVAGMAPASAVEARDWGLIERLMRESIERIAP